MQDDVHGLNNYCGVQYNFFFIELNCWGSIFVTKEVILSDISTLKDKYNVNKSVNVLCCFINRT